MSSSQSNAARDVDLQGADWMAVATHDDSYFMRRVPVRCDCGAFRRLTGYKVESDGLIRVVSLPCGRCGSSAEPEMEGDPCEP